MLFLNDVDDADDDDYYYSFAVPFVIVFGVSQLFERSRSLARLLLLHQHHHLLSFRLDRRQPTWRNFSVPNDELELEQRRADVEDQ